MYSHDPDDGCVSIMGGVLLIVGLLVLGYFVKGQSCADKSRTMGVPYSFGMMTGCMVEWKGQWVPLDNVRAF